MSTKQKSPFLLVGSFLLIGLIVIGGMIIKYGSGKTVSEGYEVTIEFDDASGIIEGGVVRLSGANVGSVVEAPKLNKNRKVDVTVVIRDDLKLPSNSTFEIVSLSLLGDKAIFIKIPAAESATLLADGDRIAGKKAAGIEALQSDAETIAQEAVAIMERANVTFEKLDATLDEYKSVAESMNQSLIRINSEVLSQTNLQKINTTIDQFSEASTSINQLSETLHPLMDDTRKTLQGVRSATSQAEKTLLTVDRQVQSLEPAIREVPKTLKSFSRTASKLETTLDSMQSEDSLLGAVTKDKEVKDDAKTFIKNLRTNGILGYKDNSDPDANDPRGRFRGIRR